MNTSDLDILYVITDLEVGGVPLHLLRLAHAMRERGWRLAVISLAREGPVGERLRDAGIAVDSCAGRGGWDWRVISRLKRLIAEKRPRLVHSLLFHANLAARYACRSAGIPASRLLCEIQTVELERRWHLVIDALTYRRCRLTIGNSPSVIEHLARRARIPRERLHLIRGGIDPSPYASANPVDRDTLGIHDDDPIVLWVGRLDPVKGLDFLCDAFGRMVSGRPGHLILVGDGPERDKLRKRIENEKQTRDHVHLLGRRDDVPALLRTADMFVLPSRTEGLPNAMLEAMAAGCPVVTTDVPGCRDLVTDGQTGLMVPFGDISRLAAALRVILDDSALAERLAHNARHEVSANWHIDRMLDEYERLYRAVRED